MYRRRFFTTVLYDVGALFRFITPFTALPLIPAIMYHEWDLLFSMGLVPILFFTIGYLLKIIRRDHHYSRHSAALSTIALFWLIMPIISMIPFILSTDMGIINGFFESMAGWTGSSFSIIPDPKSLPDTLIFWRSYLQWIGGIGIVTMMLCLVKGSNPHMTVRGRNEFRKENLIREIIVNSDKVLLVYGGITISAFLLILSTGVPIPDSINLAFSAVSTGGYVPHAENIAYYHNPMLELFLTGITLAAALPFPLFFILKLHQLNLLFKNDQIRVMLFLLPVGIIILLVNLVYHTRENIITALRESGFMVVSALTSSGFSNCTITGWEQSSILLLLLFIFIGGGAVSTSGGITLRRLALMYRGFGWWFRKTFAPPHILLTIKIDGERVHPGYADSEVSKNVLVVIFSILAVLLAYILLLHIHPDMVSVTPLLFDIISAFATCGITGGYITPAIPDASKLIFCFVMWIGRIEVLPVVILLYSLFHDPD